MASTANTNYGFDSSKLQSATAPPPVTGTGANADVGAGYGGYADSTGLNNNANAGTGLGATSNNATAPPPHHPPAGATTGTTGAQSGGYNAGVGAGGYGATTGTGTGSAKAKAYGTRAFNRFIKPGGRAGAAEKEWDIPLAILAVFVPPLAVFFKVGLINFDFVINVCLTILAWFPGVLHAWYVIFVQRSSKKSAGGPVDSTAYSANARADKTL